MLRLLVAGLVGWMVTSQDAAAANLVADGLVAGGYVGGGETEGGSTPAGTVSFGFTPRDGSAGRLRFDLTAAPLEMASQPRAASLREPQDFVLGGALVWNDWTFDSTLLQINEDRFQTDVVGAGVRFGRLGARVALAETEAAIGQSRSTMLLSTDLAAWSWLTLEGDLALTSGSDVRPDGDAAGRLGIRLSF